MQDSSNYERISKIIEKYDPQERAKIRTRAAALTSPASGSQCKHNGVTRSAEMTPMRVRSIPSCGCVPSELVPEVGTCCTCMEASHHASPNAGILYCLMDH
jgi:hypothetical protein